MTRLVAVATLIGITALLLADPTSCFLPMPIRVVVLENACATKQSCRSKTCIDIRPHYGTASARRRLRSAARDSELGAMRMAAEGAAELVGKRKTVAIEVSEGVPRGPEGAIKLTYLEINSWMWEVNGLNLLVDPLFGTLDFGLPAFLLQATKPVLWDSERVMRELAAITDVLVISQGIDDHCHPETLRALTSLLDPSVRVIAPPSARAVLEEHFPSTRITYLLPGQSTVVSKGGRAVELRATNGALLGPPWQQRENGYIVGPAAADGGNQAPEGGSLYFEPHLMADEDGLSGLTADVVIAPVVPQSVAGVYPLLRGGSKALDIARALKASKLVTMANSKGDFKGPVAKLVREGSSLKEFLDMATAEGRVSVVVPEVAKAVSVWP